MSSRLEQLAARAGSNTQDSMGGLRGASPSVPFPSAVGASPRHAGVSKDKGALAIPLDRIIPDPDQPRREFDEEKLDALAESIKKHGLLTPIAVRWDDVAERYVVIAGERRLRASIKAGSATMLCQVVDGLDQTQILVRQIIENLQREDLKPMDQARAYQRLIDDHGFTKAEVAKEMKVDAGTVTRALSLLELPERVRDRVEAGDLTQTAAYELSKVADPVEQAGLAERIVEEGLSRSEVIDAVRKVRPASSSPAKAKRASSVKIDVGDDCTVTVAWKGGSSVTVAEALRRATQRAKKGQGAA